MEKGGIGCHKIVSNRLVITGERLAKRGFPETHN